ncbi:TraB domain-containing protein [Heracleum sosnowskyi]|uniref:TraB domain-containing protein n=1 Tax=Heracleum sosnowskyi TaxID=360622 RepID=A0AAD8MC93_9APIA|nr:TraB domain-containing protein [Heracleum sosnowskyi]
MLSALVCGNFQDEEDDELSQLLRSCSSSTKKSSKNLRRRHSFSSKGKDAKNPYADRGLDKFTALLAELDSRRQKIYTQKGSEDISLLGFAYSNSSDYKPIVVRVRDKKPIKTPVDKPAEQSDSQVSSKIATPNHDSKQTRSESNHVNQNKASAEKLKSSGLMSNIKIEHLRRPSYYVPVIVIFILLFLAIFGKSFAILCVSIGWYIIPTIKSDSAKTSKGKIKTKDHTKNYSKNTSNINNHDHRRTPSSPTSVLTGSKSPPQHGSPLHPRSFT